MAISRLRPKRRIKTARVEKRAVATNENAQNQLKAGMMAISRHRSKRRIKTARVEKRAVAIRESTFCILLIKISFKYVLPSLIIKIRKCDCLQS